MKYKPTQEELIAYLYGELPQQDLERVEEFLNKNPETRKELESLQQTSLLMAEYEDEELPEQMAFIQPQRNEEWLYWRKYVAVAATLLLIVTFGALSGFKVVNSEEGLHIGFGETQYGLTEQQVADMIYQDRVMMLDFMNTSLEARNDSINQKFNTLQASLNNEDMIRTAFEQEKQALIQDITDLTEKMGDNYRGILREIVVNFSNNIETQRIEDLRNIQAAFDGLENATVNRQLDIEDAIFNLSEKVNAIAASLSNRD